MPYSNFQGMEYMQDHTFNDANTKNPNYYANAANPPEMEYYKTLAKSIGSEGRSDLDKNLANLTRKYPGYGMANEFNTEDMLQPRSAPAYNGYYSDHQDEDADRIMLGQEMARGGKLGQMKSMKLRNHTPHFGGLFHSDVPGRTDKHHISVPSGNYIIPADVVSGLGQGNTMAGGKVLDSLFPHSALQMESPATSKNVIGKFSAGGEVNKNLVKIIVAGGEYNVSKNDVKKLGNGHLESGHKVLDHFVKNVRNKTIKEMKNLPGPKK